MLERKLNEANKCFLRFTVWYRCKLILHKMDTVYTVNKKEKTEESYQLQFEGNSFLTLSRQEVIAIKLSAQEANGRNFSQIVHQFCYFMKIAR